MSLSRTTTNVRMGCIAVIPALAVSIPVGTTTPRSAALSRARLGPGLPLRTLQVSGLCRARYSEVIHSSLVLSTVVDGSYTCGACPSGSYSTDGGITCLQCSACASGEQKVEISVGSGNWSTPGLMECAVYRWCPMPGGGVHFHS